MFCKMVRFFFIKPKNGFFLSQFCIELLLIINSELLEKSNDDNKTFQVSINQKMLSINLVLGKFIDSASYRNGQLHHQNECLEIWIKFTERVVN